MSIELVAGRVLKEPSRHPHGTLPVTLDCVEHREKLQGPGPQLLLQRCLLFKIMRSALLQMQLAGSNKG